MHHGIHHFHGTPVWGSAGDVHRIAVSGAGAFVSYVRPDQIAASIQHAQVVGIDNGAFSAWVRGLKINWSDFYKWLLNYYHHPKVAFFVIPDVVDGGERDNDALINEVPKMFYGKATPVWHLHESIDRLIELCREWPRVCFGSSGEYAAIRTAHWHRRMAEPHHDGTVHWHLLCFMRKKDRRAITALLRKFAIREDREELGNNTGPRFKSELINPRKGTPTSYIAKYISKNIDGRGLAGEISKETGKSLRDNAEYVNAWASLHRVQQFRFFGIPGRQAYRELRLLAGQAARQQGDKKAGAPVLDNPRLDAILAAADAGCFATYIMKQGGVLVPRKYHLIRTAYEINEEPTAYGDHGIRVYGIWSPIAEGKICTHAVKWKMVRKAVDVQEAAADQGACAPWTRGNNCPLAENLNQQEKDKSADGDTRTDITRMDDKELHDYLHSMSKKERRELAARLRLVKPKRRKDYKQRITDHQRLQLVYELKSRGFDGSEKEVDLLLRGGSIPSGAGLRIFYRNQRLQEDDKWRNLY